MALLSFNRWCELVDGKYVDIDGAHDGQCWDTYADLCISVFGIPPTNTWGGNWSGWAYAIWDQYGKNGAEKYWDRIPAHETPRAADVAIWTDQHWYYPASHIAPVIADAGPDVLCMSQNSSAARPWLPGYGPAATGPNIRQYLTKQGLAGYLRRKVTLPADVPVPPKPKPKEWDEMATEADLERVVDRVILRRLQDPAILDAQALAVLKRPCYLVDPSGDSHKVVGTTTLATKINYQAHNFRRIENLLVQVLGTLATLHPELQVELPEAEPVLELLALEVAESTPDLPETAAAE